MLSSTALYFFLPMIICSIFRLSLSIRGSFGYERRTKGEEKLARCHSYCTFVVCSPLLRPVPNVCVLHVSVGDKNVVTKDDEPLRGKQVSSRRCAVSPATNFSSPSFVVMNSEMTRARMANCALGGSAAVTE